VASTHITLFLKNAKIFKYYLSERTNSCEEKWRIFSRNINFWKWNIQLGIKPMHEWISSWWHESCCHVKKIWCGNFSIGLVMFCMNPWPHVTYKVLYINKKLTRVEVNPQNKIQISCKEFKYDLILNLIHIERKLKNIN